MNDNELRHLIYRTLAATGAAPALEQLELASGGPEATAAALRRLHDAHAIVLDSDGSIRMALPFSAVPTPHRVTADDGSWWANCAWDTLAIPAAMDIDAAIDASFFDSGEPVELEVRGGELSHVDGFIHFCVPARNWWDDIVET